MKHYGNPDGSSFPSFCSHGNLLNFQAKSYRRGIHYFLPGPPPRLILYHLHPSGMLLVSLFNCPHQTQHQKLCCLQHFWVFSFAVIYPPAPTTPTGLLYTCFMFLLAHMPSCPCFDAWSFAVWACQESPCDLICLSWAAFLPSPELLIIVVSQFYFLDISHLMSAMHLLGSCHFFELCDISNSKKRILYFLNIHYVLGIMLCWSYL